MFYLTALLIAIITILDKIDNKKSIFNTIGEAAVRFEKCFSPSVFFIFL